MHIAHPTLAMWGGGLPVVVSMLRRWKPWRLGLTGGRDTNWTVWWKQTRQHEGFPGPTASFKGRLGPPSVVLWLRLDPGWMAMVLVMQLCLWHCHPGGCRSLLQGRTPAPDCFGSPRPGVPWLEERGSSLSIWLPLCENFPQVWFHQMTLLQGT